MYATEAEMFTLMHAMRTRIVTSPAFTSERILAAILFEHTLDLPVHGRGTAEYLWEVKHVVPFVKVDKGLEDTAEGVRLMRPITDLDPVMRRAIRHGVFGTKMRSVIMTADPRGIDKIVDQQFGIARQILAAGLIPIIEPEVDINSPSKAEAEILLRDALQEHLDRLNNGHYVMLKLTLPDLNDFYSELVAHPRVLRVAALSGGYTREHANSLLMHNHGVIASFSRALTEGLKVQQTDAEFDARLDAAIDSIFVASTVKESEFVL